MYINIFLLLFSNLYRKMPWALSDVWRHFTASNVEGKAVYICKYCAKSYVKNATKMQNHLAKFIKFPHRSQQATSDNSPSTSIQGKNDESDTLSFMVLLESEVFFTQWSNVVREMLTNALLELCMQLVHFWCSQAMCIGRDFWMFFAQHTPLQPDMLYLLICWMQRSSEGQANHRESRLYCNQL